MAAIARRYIPATITVPAGTLQAVPVSTNVDLEGHVTWERVEVLIPPGHAGTTGIAFLVSGKTVVPWSTAPAFIVGDDQDLFFDVYTDMDGPVLVRAFNLDTVTHKFLLRFQVTDPPLPHRVAAVAMLPITAGA